MSDFFTELRELLPRHHALQNDDNPAFKVLDNTVGEWFDRFDVTDAFEGLFLESASGAYLDLHGKEYGVTRGADESDDDYRKRITYRVLSYLTVEYILTVYDIPLYSKVASYNPSNNQLTSDNPYIKDNGFMSVADNTIKTDLSKRFVMGDSITWLTL